MAATETDRRESHVTDEVLASFDVTPDERLREIIRALVTHLHAFARETRLTEAEWNAGIDFLTRAGHITDDKRQEFILLSRRPRPLDADDRDQRARQPRGDRVDGVRPVLRPGLAGDRDRRRHRQGAPGDPCWVEGR